MSNLADALYEADPWFDPMYQATRKEIKGGWSKIPDDRQFPLCYQIAGPQPDRLPRTSAARRPRPIPIVETRQAPLLSFVTFEAGDKAALDGTRRRPLPAGKPSTGKVQHPRHLDLSFFNETVMFP
jgi:hypothetical protein